MTEMPDITPKDPVVIPATPEKVFDKEWMRLLIVKAPNPSLPISVYMELIPSDGVGTVLPARMKFNTIPDAFALAEKDPAFAQVLGGVLLMANKYKDIDFSREFTVNEDGTVMQEPKEG